MTDSPVTKTAEQLRIDDDFQNIYWHDPVEGCWVAYRRTDCVGEEELPAGLLVSGAPSGAAFFEAAKAERATHEGRGWTAEHDRKQGAAHPLRLALDYLANGKSVKAGALVYAALDLLASGAPSEEQIEMAWGVLNAYGLAAHIRTSGKREREVVGEMLTAAGVGSPVPVQVDNASAEALEEAAAQIPFPADPYGGFDHESLRGAYTQMTNWLRGRAEMLRGGAQ